MNRDRLLAQLIVDEGLITFAYQDSLGYWTIGIGTLIDKRKGGGLTVDECKMLALNRIDQTAARLDQAFPVWRELSDVRQESLLNMSFNLGVAGVMDFKKMLAAIQSRDYVQAAAEMRASVWAGQVGPRALRLAEMMEKG